MKTENLIEKLSSNLPPVKRIYPLPIIFSGWFLVSIVFIAFFVWNKSYYFQRIHIPDYGYELIAVILCALFSSLAAIHFSVPGSKIKKQMKFFSIFLFCAWALLLVFRYLFYNMVLIERIFEYHSCYKDILLMSLPSSAVLIYIVNGRLPVQKEWTGFWILAASASVSIVGVAFLCPNETPAHLLAIHFLPVFILGCSGIILGRILFREV